MLCTSPFHLTLETSMRLAYTLACGIMLSLTLSACGNNDTGNSNNTTPTKDMNMGQDMSTKDMTQDQSQDMAQDQSKDLGKSDMPSDMKMSDMASDMPSDMTMADMTEDMSEDMANDMMMYPDVMEYPCAYPSTDPNCMGTDYGPGSYITRLEILEDESCCRDFNGDGQPDNFVGSVLLSTAKTAFQEDVNANIKKAIELGAVIYLFEYRNWGNEAYDPMMNMGLVQGMDTDGNIMNNLSGMGEFRVFPSSFDMQGLPKYYFPMGNVYDYKLTATGGSMEIFFPGLIDGVQLLLADVQINASVKPGATLDAGGQVALGSGTLSGALLRDPLFESMNTIANRCACLGKDIFKYESGNNSWSCQLNANACEMDINSDCRNIGQRQLCNTLSFISRRADLDMDKDGKRDAYSLGAKFEAVPTKLKRF